jgi:hypothetical protein
VITIPVTYILGGQEIAEAESFTVDAIRPIAFRGSNEATLRQALADAPTAMQPVITDLYRELVLANFAKFDGKGGAGAEPELSAAFPDRGTLPGFVRKSGRFNATGMILHNARVHLDAGKGYDVLPAVLSALVEGGLPQPRCMLRPTVPDATGLPEEVEDGVFAEGTVRRIVVNAFERNLRARQACLDHYGYDCICCGFNFEHAYGEAGASLIHVHHLVPLAAVGRSYAVDPIRDLVPVCPNCHAIIHRADPPYRVNEVKLLLGQPSRPAT